MSASLSKNISQCQYDLENKGFCLSSFDLPNELFVQVKQKNYQKIDQIIEKLLRPNGSLFKYLQNFTKFSSTEFILSLRESANEWEEDGIWHDDGSRVLAFSLSLTLTPPSQGGILEIRKKGETQSAKIPTPSYGTIIIFQTGHAGHEHKINAVTSGTRLVAAGWCS
ncbi:MAG: 2OG-Fe(II) oxygenase [Bacteriovoracaceae bacterium]|jgi:hypothetical protein|nr:hypothetical protein [Halobacteriovoraceae bacterium]MDP7322194.1 2OG-Fe(II) oxygenase [Bacteriovoracaceae bacterium]